MNIKLKLDWESIRSSPMDGFGVVGTLGHTSTEEHSETFLFSELFVGPLLPAEKLGGGGGWPTRF